MPGMEKTFHEFKEGKLHSGSKKGPIVKNRKQAIAIALDEGRRAGENVAPKPKQKHHSFMSSNVPYGHATEGKPTMHAQPVGHMTDGGNHSEMDGAGRHGHDESGHHTYSEHKKPVHGDGHGATGHPSTYHPENQSPGTMGYPGNGYGLDRDGGHLIGGHYKQSEHEPARLTTPGEKFVAGHAGMHAGIGSKPHGYGHQAHQRSGVLRHSGHPGAHRIGKR